MKSLTLSYERVVSVVDPTDAARSARGKAVGTEEREDGSLSFRHGEHEVLATTAVGRPRNSIRPGVARRLR